MASSIDSAARLAPSYPAMGFEANPLFLLRVRFVRRASRCEPSTTGNADMDYRLSD
jgi:hypothetical protein